MGLLVVSVVSGRHRPLWRVGGRSKAGMRSTSPAMILLASAWAWRLAF
jgi:hypothetical protein